MRRTLLLGLIMGLGLAGAFPSVASGEDLRQRLQSLLAKPTRPVMAHQRARVHKGAPKPPLNGRQVGVRKKTGRIGDHGRRSLFTTPLAQASRLSWDGWPSPVYPQVGKILIPKDGGEIDCSGTVVSRSLVLTAGHCLYDKGFYKNALFVPGMTWNAPGDPTSVKAPWGVWKITNSWVPTPYKDNDYEAFDYGLAEIAPADDGRYVGDVAGSWNITTGIKWSTGARVYAVGYPAGGFWSTRQGYDGRGQYACDSYWDKEVEKIPKGYILWIKCTMNGGASGGPWFVRLNNGTWTIGGVNDICDGPHPDDPSLYCTPKSDKVGAAYFDNRFLDFWNDVARKRGS